MLLTSLVRRSLSLGNWKRKSWWYENPSANFLYTALPSLSTPTFLSLKCWLTEKLEVLRVSLLIPASSAASLNRAVLSETASTALENVGAMPSTDALTTVMSAGDFTTARPLTVMVLVILLIS
jgi:hypothetical protein